MIKKIIKFIIKKTSLSIFHQYKEGKNNKIIFIKNGKETTRLFMPHGLTIQMFGDNNKIILELPIKFSNAKFKLVRGDCTLVIKNTPEPINDANIILDNGSAMYIDENSSIGQGDFYAVLTGDYKTKHKIIIGKNFRAGKDTIIRTSDGHSLINLETNLATNEPQDVIIGDNVWIMSRCMIAKGASIPSNSAVAAYSFVNKPFEEENIMLAGIPARIIKHNIKWDIRSFGKYMQDVEVTQFHNNKS